VHRLLTLAVSPANGKLVANVNTRRWDAVTVCHLTSLKTTRIRHCFDATWTGPFKMASHAEITVPATRRSRKSVGGHGKDNATVNVTSAPSPAKSRVKSRSKSMGPGGLDALKPATGNRRVVRAGATLHTP
jgi:hypothetical protein